MGRGRGGLTLDASCSVTSESEMAQRLRADASGVHCDATCGASVLKQLWVCAAIVWFASQHIPTFMVGLGIQRTARRATFDASGVKPALERKSDKRRGDGALGVGDHWCRGGGA